MKKLTRLITVYSIIAKAFFWAIPLMLLWPIPDRLIQSFLGFITRKLDGYLSEMVKLEKEREKEDFM